MNKVDIGNGGMLWGRMKVNRNKKGGKRMGKKVKSMQGKGEKGCDGMRTKTGHRSGESPTDIREGKKQKEKRTKKWK